MRNTLVASRSVTALTTPGRADRPARGTELGRSQNFTEDESTIVGDRQPGLNT